MTQQYTEATPRQEAEEILQDSLFLIDMPEDERSSRLRALDAEISMLERAHLGSDDDPDLPCLSESEQRNLNWMMNWESFDRMIEKNSEHHALKYQAESNALANLALEKLYRSCGDSDTANEYLTKTKLIIKAYTAEVVHLSDDWETVNPFQDEKLVKLFKASWFALAGEAEAV